MFTFTNVYVIFSRSWTPVLRCNGLQSLLISIFVMCLVQNSVNHHFSRKRYFSHHFVVVFGCVSPMPHPSNKEMGKAIETKISKNQKSQCLSLFPTLSNTPIRCTNFIFGCIYSQCGDTNCWLNILSHLKSKLINSLIRDIMLNVKCVCCHNVNSCLLLLWFLLLFLPLVSTFRCSLPSFIQRIILFASHRYLLHCCSFRMYNVYYYIFGEKLLISKHKQKWTSTSMEKLSSA